MLELLQFCFQDSDHTLGTLIVLLIIFGGIEEIIRAIKKP